MPTLWRLVVVCCLLSVTSTVKSTTIPTTNIDNNSKNPDDDNDDAVDSRQATLPNAAGASAVQLFNEQVRRQLQRLFEAFDYTRDGLFTTDDLPRFVDAYDHDKSGSVEMMEFVAGFDMQQPTLALVAPGLFSELDTDGSQSLDLADLRAVYGRMDLNKDGLADQKEFEDYMTEVMTVLVIINIQAREFHIK